MKARDENRTEVVAALAERLTEYAGLGTVVLGLSRRGIVLAAELAERLSAPFDLLPVVVFAVPCDQRALLGAVGLDGVCVLDDALADLLDVEADAVSALRREAEVELAEQNRVLRGQRSLPRIQGRTVLLVDDCVATTLRMRAALLWVRQQDPRAVVVAAPVATQAAVRALRPLASNIVVIHLVEKAAPQITTTSSRESPSDDAVRRILGVVAPLPDTLPTSQAMINECQ